MKRTFVIILSSAVIFFALTVIITKYGYKSDEIENKGISDGCAYSDLSGKPRLEEPFAYFDEKSIRIPALAYEKDAINVLGLAHEEKWIEIDLSEQKLIAWEGDKVFLETAVSSGLPWWPTPVGEFRIWIKLRATKMEGGSGKYYYYLPNVPYVMFFENSEIPRWRGYGLHGTYWHSDFGIQRSHGCVNLPTEIAKQLYYWTGPVMPEGKYTVWSSEENGGTKVIIHE